MAWRVKVNCKHPGCNNLIDPNERYCKEHKRERWRGTRSNYNRNPLYNTAKWRRLSKYMLAKFPLCKVCNVPAAHVDHIVPVVQGGQAFNEENLQTLCVSCHSRKTAKEVFNKDRGE